MNYNKLFINGVWIDPISKEKIIVHNPANDEIISSVPSCGTEDLNIAVDAAKRAFDAWQELSLSDRISYLTDVLNNLRNFTLDITNTIVSELGCPVSFSYGEQVISSFDIFESILSKAINIDFEKSYAGYTIYREPVGVTACICPWNYPLYQLILKVVPALICGNTVVMKPASVTPLSSFYFAEAARLANLPKGVFNLITGSGSLIGKEMSSHPDIDMISFTGSTDVGKDIGARAAATVKKVSLELGGKSPCLVLKDANYELAVDTVLDSCFLNSGQTCSAFTRMYIPKSIKEEILAIISKKIDDYTCGDPLDPRYKLGSMSSKEQAEIVRSYIDSGISEGAKLMRCSIQESSLPDTFISPCVFFDVTDDMRIAKEEIFGPVLSIITYDDLDEAIKKCNDTPYGLSSCVFGSEDEAIKIAKKLRAGNVHINDSPFVIDAPFGGYKESGIGRESGELGILEFTEVKAVFH